MTHRIHAMKEKLIAGLEEEFERKGDIRNMDTNETGKIVDMIKDLAEAEARCWEAMYCKSMVESGDRMGYGGNQRQGYSPAVDRLRSMIEQADRSEVRRLMQEMGI